MEAEQTIHKIKDDKGHVLIKPKNINGFYNFILNYTLQNAILIIQSWTSF